MKVNNMKGYARDRKYTVIRMVDGEAWFYGAWDDADKAIRQAIEEGGHVIPTSAIDADSATDSVVDGWFSDPQAKLKPALLDGWFSDPLAALNSLTIRSDRA